MGCTSCSLHCPTSKRPSKPPEEVHDSPLRRRALHYVLKVGNRQQAYKFFTSVLGMSVLRHEEFVTACEAQVNGPYGGSWSKTMIGYGPEFTNFILELVYNYGIGGYNKDYELMSIEIMKEDISSVLKAGGMMTPMLRDGIPGLEACVIEFEEYRFKVFEDEGGDRIGRIVLASRDIQKTLEFWMTTLEMTKINESLSYGMHQCKVQFKAFELTSVDEAEAYGRIAFSCPRAQLEEIEARVGKCKSGGKVQVPLVKLETPGKADVEVVILKDPDGHEICFVGEEAFVELAVLDPKAEKVLQEAIAGDKSKGKSKTVVVAKKKSVEKKKSVVKKKSGGGIVAKKEEAGKKTEDAGNQKGDGPKDKEQLKE